MAQCVGAYPREWHRDSVEPSSIALWEILREVQAVLATYDRAEERLRHVERLLKEMAIARPSESAALILEAVSERQPHKPVLARLPAGSTQAEAAASILRQAGQPMKTYQIVDAMLEGGWIVSGGQGDQRRRLCDSLYSTMRKQKKRFSLIEPGLWALTAWNNESQAK